MANPDFTVDPVNFEKELWECYRRFIERVRNSVAVRFSHNRPVIPIEVNPPNQFFDVQLGTNTHNIRVRFRRDNLYLIGYQMQDSNDWLELRFRDDQPRIHGSTAVNIRESYPNLTAAAGVRNLTEIQVGRMEFINAINVLATSTNQRSRARALIVLAIMISEAVRFIRISTLFGTTGRTTAPIPAWIENYVHGWGDLSAALLRNDADNTFQLPDINNFGNLRTFEEALAIIGTMKGFFFGPPHRQRRRRSADDNINESHNYVAGRPLVEFFSVTIDNIHGNQHIRGDIYGKIRVSDGLGHECMYNRDMNGSESVRASETILINGPARCISAYGYFSVNMILMSKEGLSENDEISKGEIMWEVTNVSTNEYDKLLLQKINGRFGSATLCYAVISDAVEATIEVTLIKNNGESADVYGLVTAHNADLNSESVLFRKAHNKFVNVRPGKIIPLSRSVVAASLCSRFIVRADLKGSNIFSSDDEIAKGIATFTPQLSGTNEQNIKGDNNSQIRVKVTWAWYV